MHCVYVPNGRSLDSEQYAAKLAWLARAPVATSTRPARRATPVAVCGDFNVAPEDRDVWDPAAVRGRDPREPSPSGRRCAPLEEWGLVDVVPPPLRRGPSVQLVGYRAGELPQAPGHAHRPDDAHRGTGRPDPYALIDRNARKGKQPSDHAPVFIDTSVD